jgi:hypothetical protein
MTDIPSSNWKQVDADNINGLPSAPEGWPAQFVNESFRACIGAITRWFSRTNPTVTSTGSGNSQALSYEVQPTAYTIGDVYRFTAGYTNTGPAVLSVGSLGDISVLVHGLPLIGGELVAGVIAVVAYDSTNNFQLLNPQGRVFGDLAITGDLAVVDITTSGDVIVGDALSVNGISSFAGVSNFASDVGIGGNLNVTGNTELAGTLHVVGQLSLDDPTILIDGTPVTLLSANKYYYISTTGSDATGDGSNGNPWATPSHAAAVIQSTTNFGSYRINLLMEPGVYTLTATAFAPSTGNWEITSSTLVANDVHIEVSGFQQDGIHPIGNAQVFATLITVGATGGYSFCASGSATLQIGDVVSTASTAHVVAFDGGNTECIGAITIAGGATSCLFCEHATLVASSSGTPVTFTATGAVPFSDAFAVCTSGGFIRAVSGTFSSITATGSRFIVTSNGVISSGGEDPLTFFPGDSVGTTTDGGIWV